MPLEITQETAQKIHKKLVKANQLATEGRRSEAKAICLAVFDLCPDYPDTNQILGLIYLQDLDFIKAARHLKRAVKHFPEQPFIWLRLGQVLVELRQPEEAKKCLENALKYDPKSAEAYYRLGEIALAIGRANEAKDLFEKAIERDPDFGPAFRQLAKIIDKEKAGGLAETLEKKLSAPENLSSLTRANLAFAFGSCLEKLGREEEARDFWAAGRFLQAPNPDWHRNFAEKFEKTKEIFTTDLLKRGATKASKDFKPIFIVGLPRSGSTLLEQILASHPDIFGTDEIRFSEALFREINALFPHKKYPENIPDLKPGHLQKLAETYRESMRTTCPEKKIFTDKMLSNFHILGLLKMLFPEGRVLNIQRNPEDMGASVFKNIFSVSNAPYLANPADVGLYYTQYQDLMAFWDRLLPGFILNIRYEDLVNDPEKKIKEILKFCGLDFSKKCLAFSKTTRAVYSPTTAEVRKPINTTRIGQGKTWKQALEPLRLILGGTFPLPKSETVRQKLEEATGLIKDFRLEEAEIICRRLLEADPHQALAMKGLGAIEIERQNPEGAIPWFQKSLSFLPPQPDVWVSLGKAFIGAGQPKAAPHAFLMSQLYLPRNPEALYWLARLELGAGQHEKAGQMLTQVIDIAPDYMGAYDLILRVKGFEPGPEFLSALEKAANKGGQTELDTVYANYALATYFKDRDKEKFHHYVERANNLQKAMAPEKPDVFEFASRVAKSHFKKEFFAQKTPEKFKEITPVFIVGLHRTGSSLLEQMLAGHKDIAAGDEIPFLNSKLIDRLQKRTGKPYPEGMEGLGADDWGEIGQAYQQAVRVFAEDKPVATDKMLSNALFLGPALKAMPWAKILHIRRNLLDTAFSIYRHYFIENLKFAHDLEALADYTKQMETTLAHWKDLCPDNFLQVEYECLVETPERELKRILKFLDLPWDARVLKPHQTNRPMQTLSLVQVTEPIHSSGIGKWRQYADMLEPFKNKISDLIDEDGFLKR